MSKNTTKVRAVSAPPKIAITPITLIALLIAAALLVLAVLEGRKLKPDLLLTVIFAGVGWLALMIGLVPLVLRFKNRKVAKLERQITSEGGIKSDPLFVRGVELLNQERYRPALACFNQLYKKGADHPDVHVHRAMAWDGLKNYELAIRAMNGAIRLEPITKAFYVQRAKLHLKSSDLEAAMSDLSRAIELVNDDEDDFDLLLERAKIYEQWGRLNNALNDYGAALRLHPDAYDLHLKRAAIYEKRNLAHDELREYEAYLESGLAHERGDADFIEARITKLYARLRR